MDAIKNYYETHDEENRLTPNHGKVEFITTMKYIHEYLDEKPDSKIIEIGAATGREQADARPAERRDLVRALCDAPGT